MNNFYWIAVPLVIALSLHTLLFTSEDQQQPNCSYNSKKWATLIEEGRKNHNIMCVARKIRFMGGDGKTELVGTLYIPPDDPIYPPPSPMSVVVLSHGLGLTQDSGLDPFVRAFISGIEMEGFAAFTFDYATFGQSGGIPRQVVHPTNHVADLEAAIAMLRKRGGEFNIDVDRIALWGTSLGGGHVLVAAGNHDKRMQEKMKEGKANNTEDDYIKAVVALVPAVASAAETVISNFDKNALIGIAKITQTLVKWAAVVTWSRLLSGSSIDEDNDDYKNWYIPLVGMPGSNAMMQNPGDNEGYLSLIDKKNLFNWENFVTAASVVRVLWYRPMNWLPPLRKLSNADRSSGKSSGTPIMMIAAEKDTLCPLEFTKKAFRMISPTSGEDVSSGTRKLIVLKDAGHFDVYNNDDDRRLLNQVLLESLSFLKEHLSHPQEPQRNI